MRACSSDSTKQPYFKSIPHADATTSACGNKQGAGSAASVNCHGQEDRRNHRHCFRQNSRMDLGWAPHHRTPSDQLATLFSDRPTSARLRAARHIMETKHCLEKL